MWKVWWALPNTLCSPLLSPWHGAASCYAAAAPAADCTILVKSRVCFSPKRRWTTSVASLHGDQGNGLVIRSCRDSAPHRIRLFSEFRVNLCAVALCNTVLYKRFHPPMQVFIRPMNTLTGFSWHRFCLFLCCIGGLFSATAPFIVHRPWRQQLTAKSVSKASRCAQSLFSYRPEMAISIQNSLRRPLNELAGPGGKCGEVCAGRGNTRAFKEAKPRIFL